MAWLALSASAFLFVVFLMVSRFDDEERVHQGIVDFEKLNVKAVVRARAIGIGGDSEIAVFEYDGRSMKKILTFRGVTEIYYRKESDSILSVYVSADGIVEKQKAQHGKLAVHVNEVKTYDESKQFESSYEDYGLSKISIYDN